MTEIDAATAAALPDYEVGQVLGQGGYGVVRFGRHRNLDRPVAIKQIPAPLASDPEVRRRFVEEARTLAGFDHPHIVRLYDYVEREGLCLLVMEYLPGGSVADTINGRGVALETACVIGMVSCAGLHYAHEHRVLHRDVKPENSLYSSPQVLKVTDFGIAKVVGGRDVLSTKSGELLGTPAYMAPEQAEGSELGPAADVYATGIMLYELLSGRLPYSEQGGGLAVVYRHVYEEPFDLREVAPHVPPVLAEVVMRALEREAEDRFATAEALGVAVGSAATRAFGAGWLLRSEVRLLSPGPILDSAGNAHPPPSGLRAGSSVRVRRASPSAAGQVKLRQSALEDELRPVREVLQAPPRSRVLPWAAAALTAGAVLCAILGVGAPGPPQPESEDKGTVTINALPISSGEQVALDLTEPLQVVVRGGLRSSGSVGAELQASIGPMPLFGGSGTLTDGRGEVTAQAARAMAAGIVDVELKIKRTGNEPVRTFSVEPEHKGFWTVPGALCALLLAFLVAYAEALLRPVRRHRRLKVTDRVGMAAIGAGFGVAWTMLVWIAHLQPIALLPTALTALMGAGAGLAAAAMAAQGPRRPGPRPRRSPMTEGRHTMRR